MGLSAEEKEQLRLLTEKSKQPDTPPPSVNFNLDLGSDTAWERAKKIGLVPGDDPEPEDDKPEGDDAPRRRGFFPDD